MLTGTERNRRWLQGQRARGLCSDCIREAAPGRKHCPLHLEKHRLRYHGRKVLVGRHVTTVAMLISDLRAVAARLHVRQITWTTYEREGSLTYYGHTQRRLGLRWAELCRLAGLEPTRRGMKGLDRRPCHRCARVVPWYGEGQRWCKDCRRLLRGRKTELGFEAVA